LKTKFKEPFVDLFVVVVVVVVVEIIFTSMTKITM
jgi:hypothetical protein